MSYQPFDRVPVYFFGSWRETKERWRDEGLSRIAITGSSGGPQLDEMDPDWEAGTWDAHGMLRLGPLAPGSDEVLEETADCRVVRTPLGAIVKQSKGGSSIPQHLRHALEPTRESWKRFKAYLDPADPRRLVEGWRDTASALRGRDRVAAILGGSLFGWPREWMGVEGFSLALYDDPILYEEIVEYVADYFMALYRPILREVQFDLVYLFEDCCFRNGSLFSPDTYRRIYDRHYRRLVDFYHQQGVPLVMLDSDGKIDDLVSCWLASGIDIVFPIEVGTWRADPRGLRRRFGRRLRMFGGVDKHVIPAGERAIREHLTPLKELVAEGGYIPIPDHRIPPNCSLEQFRTYVRVFKEVFDAGE
jgi:hypothetical protein